MRAALSTAVKHAAAGVDRVRRPPAGVVVLAYHRVQGGSSMAVDLPLGLFRDQVAELAASGAVVDLDTAVAVATGTVADPPERTVAVTFDDGTADFVEHAVPVLVEHRVPVLLYVATDFLERRVPFPHDGVPVSWAALADACSTGFVRVGSHTHTHVLLDRVAPDVAEFELRRSMELVQERIGRPAHHFAYPKAVAPSPDVEAVVRRRFRSAALAGTRPNPIGATDPHRLARSPVQRGDGLRWFRAKVAGGMAAEDQLRRLVNRRRYAGATT